MSNGVDWLSNSRMGILSMAQSWCTILREKAKNDKGEEAAKYELWGIPFTVFSQFMETYDAARQALQIARNEETRNKIANSACKDTFAELEAQMRSIKKRYFHMPPLTRQDYQSLGLDLPSTERNPTGEPDSQVRAAIFLTGGFHEIGVIFEYIKGSPNDRANKEYRLYYKLVSPGENEPKSVKELIESFGTKRKRDALLLEPEDSGKKIFMAPRIENGKKKGPWGPMTSAIVP